MRYQLRPATPHLPRRHSRPSTFMSTRRPDILSNGRTGALAALHRITSRVLVRVTRCSADSIVCTTVSRYLLRIVGRVTSRTPCQLLASTAWWLREETGTGTPWSTKGSAGPPGDG